VRVHLPFKSKETKDFVFMANDVVRPSGRVEAHGRSDRRGDAGDPRPRRPTIVVAGPVVVHTGGGEHLGG
jgi:hypothetical protein